MAYLYDRVDKKSFSEFQNLFAASEGKVSIKTVDSLMYAYFRDYLQQHGLALETKIPKTTSYEVIAEGIEKLKKEFPTVKLLDQRNASFLLEEIGWIEDCLYLEVEEYQAADRKAKCGCRPLTNPSGFPRTRIRAERSSSSCGFTTVSSKRAAGQLQYHACVALEQARKQPLQKFTHIIVDESQD
jgi:hypothetical protein